MGVGTAQGHTCFLLDQWGRGLGPRLPPFALLPGVVDYLSKPPQRESLATTERGRKGESGGLCLAAGGKPRVSHHLGG